MAHVHYESIARRFEDAVERDRQLNNAEIWPEMAAGLRQNTDQLITHFLRELGQVLFPQRLDVGRRMDSVEQALRRGGCCSLRRV